MKKTFVTMMMVVMMMAMVGCGTKEDKVVENTTPTVTEDTTSSETVIPTTEDKVEPVVEVTKEDTVIVATITAKGTVLRETMWQTVDLIKVDYSNGRGKTLDGFVIENECFASCEIGATVTVTFTIDTDLNILSVEIVE